MEETLISRISIYIVIMILTVVLPMVPVLSYSAVSVLQGAHGDSSVMPKSCRSCHRGMQMSVGGEEGSCLACHGNSSARANMQSRGYLLSSSGTGSADIGAERGVGGDEALERFLVGPP